ncbi:MAG: hypothetical protein ABF391_09430 [Akkermansiaceae bacterium]
MTSPKIYYPVIAAAVIAAGAFIPTSFGGEKKQAPGVSRSASAKADPVRVLLGNKLLKPLEQQAQTWSLLSRRAPSAKTTYQLVETDASTPGGIREFRVIQMSTPFNQNQKPVSKDYLKVRYLESNDSVLIALKNDWVTIEKHPLLKDLPKSKPGQRITP